ncbi:hypothetical protein HPB52_005299 [Rhipicephalus sanguineus]|uniref:Uncharacterized protein n=1 Tax=Rhipicephalus sanguineus TaxID=34632 RepID=A0A9D4PUI8_RHISA|nr:hypothetical protein HPB52_005299 [Rhipicephalus sanguineus]
MTPLRALGALRTCEALRFDGVRGFAAARREVNTRRNVCEECLFKQGRPDGAQPLIKNALKSGKDLSQRERTAITTRIARMLALDLQPYSSVQNRGVKDLMNHMELLYKIPSRTTF